MDRIFHITEAEAWRAARWNGHFRGASLETEGFLHFSLADQVERVANALFRGRRGLVVLEVDPARAGAPVRMEAAPDGERYPHLYGPLDVSAVVRVHELRPAPDGAFRFG